MYLFFVPNPSDIMRIRGNFVIPRINLEAEIMKKKNEAKFPNLESLNTVKSVIDDADAALKDKSRKIKDSPLSETLAGAVGVGVGAGISFAALYLGGSVVGLSAAGITSGLAAAGALIGGGMVAGLAVLAAPAAILGGLAVGTTSHFKNKKLRQSKELLYKTALAKQTAILKALKEESDADKERIEYLKSLSVLLQAAIQDLRCDLGYNS